MSRSGRDQAGTQSGGSETRVTIVICVGGVLAICEPMWAGEAVVWTYAGTGLPLSMVWLVRATDCPVLELRAIL